MTCEDCHCFIWSRIDGGADVGSGEAHLASCAACRRWEAKARALEGLWAPEASRAGAPDVAAGVSAALRSERSLARATGGWGWAAGVVAATAAAGALSAAGIRLPDPAAILEQALRTRAVPGDWTAPYADIPASLGALARASALVPGRWILGGFAAVAACALAALRAPAANDSRRS